MQPNTEVTPRHHITGTETEGSTVALLDELAAEGYSGPLTERFREDLWLVGWYQLRGILRTGAIARTRLPVHHTPLEVEDLEVFHAAEEVREAIVLDLLDRCVPKFVASLTSESRSWKPGYGAALATFFIGFCTNAFHGTVYANWRNRRRAVMYELGRLDEAIERPPTKQHPQDDLTDVLAWDLAIKTILKSSTAVGRKRPTATPVQRAIASGLYRGLTHAEISAELGIPRARNARELASLREHAKRLVIQGQIDRTTLPGRPEWIL